MGQHGFGFGGWGGPWPGGWGGPGHRRGGGPWSTPQGQPGPPPWLAGLFGQMQGDQRRGPRARRGDVRAAILDVLRRSGEAGDPVNGYQVIAQIEERSHGAWRPSPGSVYPTISQLEDEGLVEADDERGRRTLRLTTAGWAYVAEHADELAEVWAAFDGDESGADAGASAGPGSGQDTRDRGPGFADLKPEIGQVMSAVWQIITTGTDRQRREAVEVLVETRRRLYGVLAETEDPDDPDDTGGPGDLRGEDGGAA